MPVIINELDVQPAPANPPAGDAASSRAPQPPREPEPEQLMRELSERLARVRAH